MKIQILTFNDEINFSLQEGDIILELNGESVYTAFKIFVETMYALPGDTVIIKVLRGEEELEFTLTYIETDFDELIKLVNSRQAPGGR